MFQTDWISLMLPTLREWLACNIYNLYFLFFLFNIVHSTAYCRCPENQFVGVQCEIPFDEAYSINNILHINSIMTIIFSVLVLLSLAAFLFLIHFWFCRRGKKRNRTTDGGRHMVSYSNLVGDIENDRVFSDGYSANRVLS